MMDIEEIDIGLVGGNENMKTELNESGGFPNFIIQAPIEKLN